MALDPRPTLGGSGASLPQEHEDLVGDGEWLAEGEDPPQSSIKIRGWDLAEDCDMPEMIQGEAVRGEVARGGEDHLLRAAINSSRHRFGLEMRRPHVRLAVI